MRKRRIWIGSGLLVLLAAGIAAQWAPRLTPGILAVHVAPGACRRVRVETAGLAGAIDQPNPGATVTVSPVVYGPHLVRFDLADGRTLWVRYYHTDAGVRRRVDLYLAVGAGGAVSLRCAVLERPDAFSRRPVVFYDGSVDPARTTRAQPLRIGGP